MDFLKKLTKPLSRRSFVAGVGASALCRYAPAFANTTSQAPAEARLLVDWRALGVEGAVTVSDALTKEPLAGLAGIGDLDEDLAHGLGRQVLQHPCHGRQAGLVGEEDIALGRLEPAPAGACHADPVAGLHSQFYQCDGKVLGA